MFESNAGPQAGIHTQGPESATGANSCATLDELLLRAEPNYWEAVGRVSPAEDIDFSKPDGYCWYWKGPLITYGLGVPAILLLAGVLFLPSIAAAFGPVATGSLDLTRIMMFALSIACLALASPIHRPLVWDPQDDARDFIERDRFRRKYGR